MVMVMMKVLVMVMMMMIPMRFSAMVSLEDYAPDLYKACTLKRLTLREALTDGKWTRHFRWNLT
jgi:hypothetical protein